MKIERVTEGDAHLINGSYYFHEKMGCYCSRVRNALNYAFRENMIQE